MESKEFKKKYPALAKELEEGSGKADIEFTVEPPKPKRRFKGYEPDVIDFIRRCSKDAEALEIIEYMKNREEITVEEAENLCKQLKEEGLHSFGKKKDPSHYERKG